MLQVKQERNHTRDTTFGNYLRANYELAVSRWMPEFSKLRRSFGYEIPSIDIDSMLYTRKGDLLAIFETKRGDEPLSRAEKDVIRDLANKCQKPAFVLRYWNDNDSWFIKPEPLNGYATEFTSSDVALDEMKFEEFLSDLGWRWFVPGDNDPLSDYLYFPMIEFDHFKVKGIVNFASHGRKLTPTHANSPEFKMIVGMANACEVPALSVVFEPSLGWFKTYPLNHMAESYCNSEQYYSEVGFVDLMYRIHGQPMPTISGLRDYRPSANQRRIPPNPANYQVNRALYANSGLYPNKYRK